MNFPSSNAFEGDARLSGRAARAGVGLLLALVLVGPLADAPHPEEAYVGIDTASCFSRSWAPPAAWCA